MEYESVVATRPRKKDFKNSYNSDFKILLDEDDLHIEDDNSYYLDDRSY